MTFEVTGIRPGCRRAGSAWNPRGLRSIVCFSQNPGTRGALGSSSPYSWAPDQLTVMATFIILGSFAAQKIRAGRLRLAWRGALHLDITVSQGRNYPRRILYAF